MSAVVISHEPAPEPRVRDTGIRRRLFTRAEYYRAAETGVFRPDERLELLDGEIIQKVSPQNPPHGNSISRSGRVLGAAFGGGYYVRQQQPLVLTDKSEPEPDLLVVPGTEDDYVTRHPEAIETRLLVEVSDTTLRLDQGRKRSAYARAGIAEYWILNLSRRRLEIYRDPSGSRYNSITSYSENETVTPLSAPHAQIRVADLLPPLPAPQQP